MKCFNYSYTRSMLFLTLCFISFTFIASNAAAKSDNLSGALETLKTFPEFLALEELASAYDHTNGALGKIQKFAISVGSIF